MPFSPPPPFFFIKFSFQATPHSSIPLPFPITQTVLSLMHHSWFCSLMHSISFTATLSNLHHRLLSSVPALSPLHPSATLVMSCLGFSSCCCFLPLSISILAAQLSLSLHPCSFNPFFYSPSVLSPSHSLSHHFHFSSSFSHPALPAVFFFSPLSFSPLSLPFCPSVIP